MNSSPSTLTGRGAFLRSAIRRPAQPSGHAVQCGSIQRFARTQLTIPQAAIQQHAEGIRSDRVIQPRQGSSRAIASRRIEYGPVRLAGQ
jgi:hypothetical protein